MAEDSSSEQNTETEKELLEVSGEESSVRSVILKTINASWFLPALTLTVAGGLYLVSANSRGLFPFRPEVAVTTPVSASSPQATPSLSTTPTETPDLIADWKTYQNEQYGFEFKYPSQWMEKDGHIDIPKNGTPEVEGQLIVNVSKNKDEGAESGGFPLEDSVSKSGFTIKIGYSFFGADFYKLALREKDANWIEILLTYYSSSKFYLGDQDKVSSFYKNNNDPGMLKHFSYFDQILSTFKFITLASPGPAPSTSPGAGGPTPQNSGSLCAQVITPARNPQTGEIKDFTTPCDVPKGWEVVK